MIVVGLPIGYWARRHYAVTGRVRIRCAELRNIAVNGCLHILCW